MSLNYADVAVGLLLTLGFVKGFIAGLWASILGLAGTLVSFLGAYFFTQPVVNYLEKTKHWVTDLTGWWDRMFSLLPSYSEAYDPNAVVEFFANIDSTPWLKPISSLIKARFLEIEAQQPPGATWGSIFSSLMAQILISGLVFFALLILVRILWSLFSRTLTLASALSVSQRFLGGLLQLGVSALWLSLMVGAFYPLLGLELLGSVRETVSSSGVIGFLLGLYKFLIPAVLVQIKPPL